MSLDLVIARKAEDHISSEDVQKIFETILGEERIVVEQPTIVSTLGQVVVTGGTYYLHGRYCYHREGTTDTLEVDPVSAAGKYRKDVLCIQYTVNNNIEDAEYVIVKGSEADSESAATYPQNKDDDGDLINGFRYVIAFLTVSSTAVNYKLNTGVNKLINYDIEQESTFFGGNILKQIGYISKGIRNGIVESEVFGYLPNRFSAALTETPKLQNPSSNSFKIVGTNMFLDGGIDPILIDKSFNLTHKSGGKVTYAIVEVFDLYVNNHEIVFNRFENYKFEGSSTTPYRLNLHCIGCTDGGSTREFSPHQVRLRFNYNNDHYLVCCVVGYIFDLGSSWKIFNKKEIDYLNHPLLIPSGEESNLTDYDLLCNISLGGSIVFDNNPILTYPNYRYYIPRLKYIYTDTFTLDSTIY